ncbi:hypothetical protein HDV01_003634 [Terramyces sp. JEL0728]|nr:hypothetical protein HDV01_003634 [Terramyces sp. JEL0728]
MLATNVNITGDYTVFQSVWMQGECSGAPTSMYTFDQTTNGTLVFQDAINAFLPPTCGLDPVNVNEGCCVVSLDNAIPEPYASQSFHFITTLDNSDFPKSAVGTNYCKLTAKDNSSLSGLQQVYYKADGSCIDQNYICTSDGTLQVYNDKECQGKFLSYKTNNKTIQDALMGNVSLSFIDVLQGGETYQWTTYTPQTLLVPKFHIPMEILSICCYICSTILSFAIFVYFIVKYNQKRTNYMLFFLLSQLLWMLWTIFEDVYYNTVFESNETLSIFTQTKRALFCAASLTTVLNTSYFIIGFNNLNGKIWGSMIYVSVVVAHLVFAGSWYLQYSADHADPDGNFVSFVLSWNKWEPFWSIFTMIYDTVPSFFVAIKLVQSATVEQTSAIRSLWILHQRDKRFSFLNLSQLANATLFFILICLSYYTGVLMSDRNVLALSGVMTLIWAIHGALNCLFIEHIKILMSIRSEISRSNTLTSKSILITDPQIVQHLNILDYYSLRMAINLPLDPIFSFTAYKESTALIRKKDPSKYIQLKTANPKSFNYICLKGHIVQFKKSLPETSPDEQLAILTNMVNTPKSFHPEIALGLFENLPDFDLVDDLFFICVANGALSTVQKLLSNENVDPSHGDNRSILLAAKLNNPLMVSLLLGDERVDPTDQDDILLKSVADNNQMDILSLLLEEERIYLNAEDNYVIRTSCTNGNVEMVKSLLHYELVDPADMENEAIRTAASNGHYEIVKLLLEDQRVDPSDLDNEAIGEACKNGHLKIVKALLKDSRVDPSDGNNYCICIASEYGFFDIVKVLMDDERVDPSADNNHSIQVAAENNHLPIMQLLLADKRTDISADDYYSVKIAANMGHLDILKYIFSELNVPPNIKDDCAVQEACEGGQFETVKYLLGFENVDSSVDENYPIRVAAEYGFISIVKILMEHPKVDPADLDNYAIGKAAENGHYDVVQLLLDDIRVNAADDDNYAVRLAANNGHTAIVKLLLTDPRVDPTADDGYALGWAAQDGHLDTVKFLLSDNRIDPAVDNQYAIRFACQNGHIEVVKFLLNDPRVDPTVDDNFCIRIAMKRGYKDMVELLLSDPRVGENGYEDMEEYSSGFGKLVNMFRELTAIPIV